MIYPILYKRATDKVRINTWTIEVQDNKYRTISGFYEMTQTTSEWTVCEGKNIGKKNETTADQQAKAEAEALYRKRKENGFWDDISDCDNIVFFQPMLAKSWDDEKKKIIYPIFSQPKLDGIRCIVKSDGMWTRNGKEIISAPHIFGSLKHLFDTNPDLILDGELYAEKNVIDFNTIISLVRKTKPTLPDLLESRKYIKYHVYDIPSVNDIFSKRWESLITLPLSQYCVKVNTYIVNNEQEVNEKYKEYMFKGYEGQMLRIDTNYENKRTKFLLKHKTFVDEEFEILGVSEGKGNMSGKVGKLHFKAKNGKPFDSPVNGDWAYLAELLERDDLVGKKATVKYFELTEDGVPRFPKVIQIDRID